jgi:hypothetical protein
VELRVGDGSWRILPTASFMTHRKPRPGDQKQPPSQFVEQSQQDDQQNPQAQQQVPPPSQNADRPTDHAAQARSALNDHKAPLAALLVSLLLWAVPAAKAVRRLARRRASRPSARVAAAWRELLDSARDVGLAVPEGRTRQVQGRALRVSPELAVEVDARVFGAVPPTGTAANEVWRAMDEQRRVLTRRQPTWRRLVAPFNPASLLHRGDRGVRPARRLRLVRGRRVRPA